LTPKQIALAAGKLALEKNGFDVTIIDLRKRTDVASYFVVCSGSVDVHVKAIADNIVDGLKAKDTRVWHMEGYRNLQWVLLDYVNVVVHVFQPKQRDYYSLEKLWGDAPKQTLE
jgi:ribosome-associated protein